MATTFVRCRKYQEFELRQFCSWLNKKFPKIKAAVQAGAASDFVLVAKGKVTERRAIAVKTVCEFAQDILDEKFPSEIPCGRCGATGSIPGPGINEERTCPHCGGCRYITRSQAPGARSPESHGQNDEQNAETRSTDS